MIDCLTILQACHLLEICTKMDVSLKVGIISGTGDRRMGTSLGKIASTYFDEIIIKTEIEYLRSRTAEEIVRVTYRRY